MRIPPLTPCLGTGAWAVLFLGTLSTACRNPRPRPESGQDTLFVARDVRPAERQELQTGLLQRF